MLNQLLPQLIRDSAIKIYVVISNATGAGVYNCYVQKLQSSEWAETGGVQRFTDKDDPPTSVEVLNLFESYADSWSLEAQDLIAAWKMTDGTGVSRLVGIPLISTGAGNYTAYVAEDAPPRNYIKCFLDFDGTVAIAWATPTDWEIDDAVVGDDNVVYQCTSPYSATDDTTKPGVVGQETVWGAYWVRVQVIIVYCKISGGGNLEDAYPNLRTMQKITVFTVGTTIANWVRDYNYSENDYVKSSNTSEVYRCLTGHLSTADNRPTSGYDWNNKDTPYWEIAYSPADELNVTPKDDCDDIEEWSIRKFSAGDMIYGDPAVSGDDTKIYFCPADYDATDATTRPGSGASWKTYWLLIDGIYETDKGFDASNVSAPNAP
jgi:hypothetical protein